jgi:hypothetical protein
MLIVEKVGPMKSNLFVIDEFKSIKEKAKKHIIFDISFGKYLEIVLFRFWIGFGKEEVSTLISETESRFTIRINIGFLKIFIRGLKKR